MNIQTFVSLCANQFELGQHFEKKKYVFFIQICLFFLSIYFQSKRTVVRDNWHLFKGMFECFRLIYLCETVNSVLHKTELATVYLKIYFYRFQVKTLKKIVCFIHISI